MRNLVIKSINIIFIVSCFFMMMACNNPVSNCIAPKGMVLIPEGANKNGEHIKPFFMDATPVTVGQFDEFVKAAGYKTEAQKFGNAGVFDTL
ncbi:MAG: SUMF1/EgtB/PvdO family nonheme iron enzyme, partial [Parafilimonas sp.]